MEAVENFDPHGLGDGFADKIADVTDSKEQEKVKHGRRAINKLIDLINKPDWKSKSNKDGIEVFTRKSEYHGACVKAIAVFPFSVEQIKKYIADPLQAGKLNEMLEKIEVIGNYALDTYHIHPSGKGNMLISARDFVVIG